MGVKFELGKLGQRDGGVLFIRWVIFGVDENRIIAIGNSQSYIMSTRDKWITSNICWADTCIISVTGAGRLSTHQHEMPTD